MKFLRSPLLAVLILSLNHLYTLQLSAAECDPPLFTVTDVVSTNTAQLNWIGIPDDAISLELELYSFGSAPDGVPEYTIGPVDSLIIDTLSGATLYFARIRAICADSLPGEWSVVTRFATFIPSPGPCQFHLPIRDESCSSGQADIFGIEVEDPGGYSLGSDIFLDQIDIILSHTWPADLRISLKNPNGASTLLSLHKGTHGNHFGNPNDSLCLEVASFRQDACTTLGASTPPFIGTFLPDGDLGSLHDLSDPSGIWQLEVCDRAASDIGELRSISFHWSSTQCLAPAAAVPGVLTDTSVWIYYGGGDSCDSLIAEITSFGGDPQFPDPPNGNGQQIQLDCGSDSVLITGLESGVAYDLRIYQMCNGTVSPPSCPVSFQLLCGPVRHLSSFDALDLCSANCIDPCEFQDSIWHNISTDDTDWIVHSGGTLSSNTGPASGVFGQGNYIYYESSGPGCRGTEIRTILESSCLEVASAEGDCHLSYYASLHGESVNKLVLEISLDQGNSWNGIDSLSGNQGQEWQKREVSLSGWEGQLCVLRFVAHGASGSRGDIGLDEILLHHLIPVATDLPVYFADGDGDGYGDPSLPYPYCSITIPDGYSDNMLDCEDSNESIHPGAQEIPCNLIDENCNGAGDDDEQTDPLDYETIQRQDVSCEGQNDGLLEIEVSGGVPPYDFEWNTGQDTGHIEQLTAGIYYCEVRDSQGCLLRTEFYDLEALELMNFVLTDEVRPSCSIASDGKLTVLFGGGDPPYSPIWNTGDTTSTITGLSSGSYQLTVSDGNACVFMSPVYHLSALEPIDINAVNVNPVSCHGNSDGSVFTFVSGDSGPFTYQWGHGDTLRNISGLSSGFYHLTVTDQDQCIAVQDSIFVPEPEPLSFQISVLDPPSCYGESDGRIQIHISGGTPQYTAWWYDGHTTRITNDLLNVTSGYYDLTVSDNKSCSISQDSIYLSSPEPILIELDSIREISCPFHQDGYLAVEASGGSGFLSFEWSTGKDTSRILDSLAVGNYNVTVTDEDGCSEVSGVYELGLDSDPIEVIISILDSISCFGEGDGIIQATAAGGSLPYIFNWSSGDVNQRHESRDSLYMLTGGNYSLTVTDRYGCSGVSAEIILPQPPLLLIQAVDRLHPSCHGSGDGQMEVMVQGGTAPYQAAWSDGGIGFSRDSLFAGNYSLTITDRMFCEAARSNILLIDPDTILINLDIEDAHSGMSDGAVALSISGPYPPYDIFFQDSLLATTNGVWVWGQLSAGTYELSIRDENGCERIENINIGTINSVIDPSNAGWMIFPNPMRHELYIIPEDAGSLDMREIGPLLFNATGQQLDIEIEEYGNGYRIATDHLPAAAYYMRILWNTGERSMVPLIKFPAGF